MRQTPRVARYELSGKVALVTGAARGIGFETARALIGRGASVVLVDLAADDAERAASALHDERALGLAADVTDRGALQRAMATAVERFAGVDVVVANAGVAPRVATLRASSSENFERVLDVNLLGVYRTVDVALGEVVRRRGHVVVVASVYAFLNGAGAIPYAMSKAGVEQLGRALRVELTPHGASASVAYFGFIDTEMVHRSIDQDPLAEAMMGTFPRPLHKRLAPAVAGEAIARGIERRAPRIIRPHRWIALSVLRGIINPLGDAQMERDQTVRELTRELDARAGEEQPLTA
jgi:NAD(P)-dependent dehydrogenase (short-subunit alcohol dehydrogenase family)